MILGGAAALMLLLFDAAVAEKPAQQTSFAQLSVRQQIIIRVPQGVRQVAPASNSLIRWEERRGPRCVEANAIVGATLLGQNSVDLIMRDHSRVRARLERSCPALDYYYGFYINATGDGRICEDRDSIRSRMGGECQIDRFRSLRPVADR